MRRRTGTRRPEGRRGGCQLKGRKARQGGRAGREHIEETFSYYAFPDQHWIKLKTNNPLERIMREIRRRTRVVGAFPDAKSCLNLAAARLRHIAGTRWSTKRLYEHAATDTDEGSNHITFGHRLKNKLRKILDATLSCRRTKHLLVFALNQIGQQRIKHAPSLSRPGACMQICT